MTASASVTIVTTIAASSHGIHSAGGDVRSSSARSLAASRVRFQTVVGDAGAQG